MAPKTRNAATVVVATAFFLCLFNNDARVYENHDVTRYAQMVLEMEHRGTWIPYKQNEPYFEAMPVAAWAPLVSSRVLGGLSPASVRLPSALATLASMLLLMWFGARATGSRRLGIIAGAVFVLTPMVWNHARMSRIDPWISVGMLVSMIGLFEGCREERARRLGWFALSGVGLAIGITAKGLLPIAITGSAAAAFIGVERRWKDTVLAGGPMLVVGLGLTAAWLWPYLHYLGPEKTQLFYDEFIVGETFRKFEGSFGKVEPVWSFLFSTFANLLPWSILGLAVPVGVLRRPGAATPFERLATVWLLAPLVMLCFSEGKHVRYVLPLIPALALLTAVQFERWLAAPPVLVETIVHHATRGFGMTFVALGLAGPVIFSLVAAPTLAVFVVGAVCAGGGLLAFRRAPRDLARGLLGTWVAVAAIVTFLFAAVLATPSYNEYEAEYLRLANLVRPYLGADESLVVFAPDRTRKLRHASIEASQLALHLDNRWIDTVPWSASPPGDVLLVQEPLDGHALRAEIEWLRDEDDPVERWLIVDGGPRP